MNNDTNTKIKKKSFIKKLTSTRKFKYGSSSVIFTAIFIVFVILLNVVVSVIDSKTGGLYADMTSKKLYGITDATREALKDVTLPVEIIFCRPADILESANSYSESVKRLAESYASEFHNITVKYHDIVNDPTYFNQFKTASTDIISDSSIIVYCPTTKVSVVYTLSNMYKMSTQNKIFAFDGENKLTTAILNTARPQGLKAAFTKGHGENVSESLRSLLGEQGYEVSTIDLKTTSKDELSKYNLVVVCNPSSDFTGLSDGNEGNVNEIALLNEYLTGSFGNLMVYLSPDKSPLPELSQFLSDDWGVSYTPGSIMWDDKNNAVSSDGLTILGNYSTDEATSGYKLHSAISKKSTGSRAFFDYSVPLNITFSESGYKTVSAVVTTSENSRMVSGSKTEKAPNVPLMVLSDYAKTADSMEKHAYVLTCGSAEFLDNVYSQRYANTDLIKSALKLMGNGNIAVNIDFKVLDESDLSVTKSVADRMTRRLGIIVPVIISVVGICVFIKRKYL